MKKLTLKTLFIKKAPTPKHTPVAEIANKVFSKYEKTFRDLARYDRGEKVITR